ncbi:TRAP transporter permease [Deinococcus sp. SM5_A1]|uniref:TRAP transporter permease n=1 Tax=Deinococcus sp. SM5_A1 TaxID=3379094 RepID=UPI00385FBBBD
MEHQTELLDGEAPVATWLRRLTKIVLIIAALYHLYLVVHPFLPWSGSGIKILELTQVQRATHVFFIVLAGYLLTSQQRGRKTTLGGVVFALLTLPALWEFLRLDLPLIIKAVTVVIWALVTLPAVLPRLQKYGDLLVAAAMFAPYFYLLTQFEELIYRAVVPEPWDLAMGFALTLSVLGLTFRFLGPVLPSLVLVFMTYNLFGNQLPGVLGTAGMPIDLLIGKMFSETEAGLFGIITAVSLKYLVYFTLLGSVITALGFGPVIARLALRAVGRSPAAPGRSVAVMSVFMGLFSGSGAADTQFVATVTKPLMERSGYPKLTAAGITATAGSIALITPPVLGSIAFVMVEVLNIPYLSICLMALGPCVLYLAGVWFYNELYVRRSGFVRDVMPDEGKSVLRSLCVFLPLLLIMVMLYLGYNVSLAVSLALVSFIVLAYLDRDVRPPVRRIFDGLADGFAHLVPIGAAVVSANMILTMMVLTGLPSKMSQVLTLISGQNLLMATLFAAVFSLVLGMGIPPIATYVLTSALVAPSLVALSVQNGIPPEAALLSTHMFLFYYAILADVTPPVALSAFAAASVWNTDPIRTGLVTARVALPKYFLGMFFLLAYPATAILIVPVVAHQGLASALPLIIYRFAVSILGVLFISGATVGFTRRTLKRWEGWVLGLAGVALLSPYWWLNVPGLLIGAYFFLMGPREQPRAPDMSVQEIAL